MASWTKDEIEARLTELLETKPYLGPTAAASRSLKHARNQCRDLGETPKGEKLCRTLAALILKPQLCEQVFGTEDWRVVLKRIWDKKLEEAEMTERINCQKEISIKEEIDCMAEIDHYKKMWKKHFILPFIRKIKKRTKRFKYGGKTLEWTSDDFIRIINFSYHHATKLEFEVTFETSAHKAYEESKLMFYLIGKLDPNMNIRIEQYRTTKKLSRITLKTSREGLTRARIVGKWLVQQGFVEEKNIVISKLFV